MKTETRRIAVFGDRPFAARIAYTATVAAALLLWTAAYAQEAQPLTNGLNQERTLGPGDNHVYTVTLQEGAGVVGEADQRGIDLVIDIFGPDGKLLRTVDSPNGTQGPEPIDLTAFQTGIYKLVIHTLDEKAMPGKYLMKIDRIMTAGENAQRMAQEVAEHRKFDELVSFLRTRNAKQYAITSPTGIDEAKYVTIGGIDQWVTIRGEDRNNPVLLFLHGGPGDVTSNWTFSLFAPWEKQFTVVQWDQRGAGKTLRKTVPVAQTMTVERLVQDGIELSDYLRKHLGKEKIIIVCHSFGTILGLSMAQARPDLFYAYVGTGQVGDETRNYSVAYDDLVKKAQAVGNQQALDDLKRVGPPPYKSGEGYGVQRRWANAFEGADQFLNEGLGLKLVAPGYTMQDFNDSEEGQLFSGQHLVRQSRSKGPKELGLDFSIPMFIFQGEEDFTSPTSLAREYEAAMKAPQKAFVTIHGGGHFAVFMKPDQFLNELVARVRPLATKQ
ncbi:MAG TPA: alpha/beta hydrolase [Alphaproteobacteria bacterium]|nr:alpha/beta hydrolase [Alphaproteobacteria bacterium]